MNRRSFLKLFPAAAAVAVSSTAILSLDNPAFAKTLEAMDHQYFMYHPDFDIVKVERMKLLLEFSDAIRGIVVPKGYTMNNTPKIKYFAFRIDAYAYDHDIKVRKHAWENAKEAIAIQIRRKGW